MLQVSAWGCCKRFGNLGFFVFRGLESHILDGQVLTVSDGSQLYTEVIGVHSGKAGALESPRSNR